MAKRDQQADAAAAAPDTGIRVARHPRARRDIGLAKSWGGVAAFAIVLLLSLRAGVPTSDAVLRAIAGGLVGYVAAWGIAVTVWRQLLLAELEAHRRRVLAPPDEDAAKPRAT
jgi:uncharacterized membrane protein YccC